jgi:Putative transposase/Transposase zinc-binding domain
LLRQYTPDYLEYYGGQAVPQVQSVLAKLALCRTAALGGHVYECPQCQHRCSVYNSCIDRHCPLCSGGRRADWLQRTAELLLPKSVYFQVVFTLPDQLWPLMLGNRRATYRLLFHAAWAALREVLREELGCEPAALMVLHTWNQRLEHDPHLHALVPGGGPALDGQQWVQSRHRRQPRRRQPYLVDHELLSARFRDKFLAGLTRLHRDGKLKLTGKWSSWKDPAAFSTWLKTFSDCAWVVFIEPPPTEQAQPEHVLKYLARYLTGGPISDHRLIDHQDDEVTFWARSPDKKAGNRPEPYTLPGVEFTRRWALHILPKGFVKSRCFGGFSCRHRKAYLSRCRALLGAEPPAPESAQTPPEEPKPTRICPKCQTPLECISQVERPGWNRVLNGPDRPGWYDPFGHALAWGGLHWYREPPDG